MPIHHTLKHSGILELITFFEDQNYVCLVLELARFQKQSSMVFTEPGTRAVLDQVVSGLIYLHGIMHINLTQSNVRLTSDSRLWPGN